MELQKRKCQGCDSHFRVLVTSPQTFCNFNCRYLWAQRNPDEAKQLLEKETAEQETRGSGGRFRRR